MTARHNLVGQKFGRYIVQSFSHKDNYGQLYWLCICECGTEKLVRGGHLRSGFTKSCGCYLKEVSRDVNLKDISGQTFGYLTAIRRTDKRSGRLYFWECKCACGNTCCVRTNNLTTGKTTSCGCRRISHFEETVKDILLTNTFIFEHQYALPKSGKTSRLTVDFLVFCGEIRIAIECQGRQHYEALEVFGGEIAYCKQIERDIRKKTILASLGIPLVEIPYWEKDIEPFVLKELRIWLDN